MTQIEQSVNQNREDHFNQFAKHTINKNIKIDTKILNDKAKMIYLLICHLAVGYQDRNRARKYIERKYKEYLPSITKPVFKRYLKKIIAAGIIEEINLPCKLDKYLQPDLKPFFEEQGKERYFIPDAFFKEMLPLLNPEDGLFLFYLFMCKHNSRKNFDFDMTLPKINEDFGAYKVEEKTKNGEIKTKIKSNTFGENYYPYIRAKLEYLGFLFATPYRDERKNLRYKYSINLNFNLEEATMRAAIFPKTISEFESINEKRKILTLCTTGNQALQTQNQALQAEKEGLLHTNGAPKCSDKSLGKSEQIGQPSFLLRMMQKQKLFKKDLFFNEIRTLPRKEIYEQVTVEHIYNLFPNDKNFKNNIVELGKKALEIEPNLIIYTKSELDDILIKVSVDGLKRLYTSNFTIGSSLFLYLASPKKNEYFKKSLLDYLYDFPIDPERLHEHKLAESARLKEQQRVEIERTELQRKLDEEKRKLDEERALEEFKEANTTRENELEKVSQKSNIGAKDSEKVYDKLRAKRELERKSVKNKRVKEDWEIRGELELEEKRKLLEEKKRKKLESLGEKKTSTDTQKQQLEMEVAEEEVCPADTQKQELKMEVSAENVSPKPVNFSHRSNTYWPSKPYNNRKTHIIGYRKDGSPKQGLKLMMSSLDSLF